MPGGKLIVLSAPSGSGKTTIAHAVLGRIPSLRFSVSATTRPRRSGETEGRDYFFLSEEEFGRRVRGGEFVEWEEIYGHRYGTLEAEVRRAVQGGRHIIFDVDVKGALSIRERFPEALLIFIRPPDRKTLERRLRGRQTEDGEALRRRLERVPMEMEMERRFDHTVVNDDVHRASEEVHAIIQRHLQQQGDDKACPSSR
ncbi:MAG: guanylate kinase [Bacteroidota bacterium]